LEYLVVGCFFAFVAWAVGLPEQVLKGSRLDYMQNGLTAVSLPGLYSASDFLIGKSGEPAKGCS